MTAAVNSSRPIVTSGAFPASRKIYVEGQIYPDILVPMREIALHPTAEELPVTVYDSSGVCTDPAHHVAINGGLPRLRESWIMNRGDVVRYSGRRVKRQTRG